MEKKKQVSISQILVDYGVYNQSGVNGYELDVELNTFMNRELVKILKGFKKIYMDREKMGRELDNMIKDCEKATENYG